MNVYCTTVSSWPLDCAYGSSTAGVEGVVMCLKKALLRIKVETACDLDHNNLQLRHYYDLGGDVSLTK